MKKSILFASLLLACSFAHATNMDSLTLTNPTALASLGTPANGTVRYCSNCAPATNPCAATGSGAVARRENGAWNCGVDTSPTGQTAVGTTRTITSGAGLTGGGDLSANRTLVVGQNADNSIIVNADDIQRAALGGDLACALGSNSCTFNTVNSNIGTWNNVTINAKGLATAGSNVAYLTGNETITLSGDVTGSGATSITTTYAGVVPANKGGAGAVNGILKANGSGVVSAAVSSTDYAPATSGSTVLLGNASGGFSSYAGTSCTNQFPRSLSTAGAATCAGVAVATDITGLGTGVATFLATPSSANLASALTDETGTGFSVFATSPTLVTPLLGTPTSVTLTNATGLPISSGVSGLGANVATFLATPSSANLASAITDEIGTGFSVFDTSPTLTTPTFSGTSTFSAGSVLGTGTITTAGTSAVSWGQTLNSSVNATQFGLSTATQFTPTGASLTNIFGIDSNPSINTTAFTISTYGGNRSRPETGAGFSGTISNLTAFQAPTPTIGGGTITIYRGFDVANFATATNVRGFEGRITSGTNKYNLYMSGDADNYLAGKLGIALTDPDANFTVAAPDASTSQVRLRGTRAPIVLGDIISGIESFSNDTSNTAPGLIVSSIKSIAGATHTGSDLNTRVVIAATGSGSVSPLEVTRFVGTNTSVNAFQIQNAATGNAPSITAIGTDANIGINFTPKASGVNNFGGGISLSGNLSLPAWTTNGIALKTAAATYIDTTSSGTVAVEAVNALGTPTIQASSATTITNASTLYIKSAPTAGTNVTISNTRALHIASGSVLMQGGATINGSNTLLNFNDGANTVSIGTGTTTGTVSIGGGSNLVTVGSHLTFSGTAGTVAAGAGACGTSPSVAGNDNVGRITVGSSTNGGVCTLTFNTAWVTNAPVCNVKNDTSTVRTVTSAETTTTMTVTAITTLTAGDVISYKCSGY